MKWIKKLTCWLFRIKPTFTHARMKVVYWPPCPTAGQSIRAWMNELADVSVEEIDEIIADKNAQRSKVVAAISWRLATEKMTPLDETSSGGLVEVIRGADGKLRKYVRLG